MGEAIRDDSAEPRVGTQVPASALCELVSLGVKMGLLSPDVAAPVLERLARMPDTAVELAALSSWLGVDMATLDGLHRQSLGPSGAGGSPLFPPGAQGIAQEMLAAPSTRRIEPRPAAEELPTARLDDPAAICAPRWRPNIPKRLGAYDLLEELGHGGMGIVYRARHEKLGTLAAIKVLIAGEHASPEEIRRFQLEAAAVARMGKHPNIVSVHDLATEGGLTYYAMEYVEGRSLRQEMKQRELSSRDAAALVEKVARALHYAHQSGVIHRDMKPDNIVVRRDGEPQVMDFGLARDVQSTEHLSLTGQVMGTLAYMAPEQAAGEVDKTDARTDVYALGGVLYELLTGLPPHPGKTLAATLPLILRGEIVAPRSLRPEAPRDLETIAMKALSLEASQRYATAEAFAEDLARFSRGEPVLARPVGWWVKALRKVRRHPRVAAFGAVCLALLSVMGVVLAVQRRAVERETRATEAKRQANELYTRAIDPPYVSTHGGLDESQRLLEQAVALDPGLRDAHFRLGMLWEARGDAPHAAASYESAVRCDPSFLRARYRLITILIMESFWLGHPKGVHDDDALARSEQDHMKFMEEHAPSDPYTRLAALFREVYHVWRVETPLEKLKPTIEGIEDLAKLESVPEAKILLAQIEGPAYYHPIFSLNVAVPSCLNPDRALCAVEFVANHDPLDILARFQLGIIRYHLEDEPGAEREIDVVRRYASSWSEPLFYLGRIRFNQRRYDEAEEYLRQGLALKDEAKAWSLLAWTCLLRDEVPGALEATDKARRLYPGMTEYAVLRLVALYCAGEVDKAQGEVSGIPDQGMKDLRELDAGLQRPEGRMILQLAKLNLRGFEELFSIPPKDKARVNTLLATVTKIPRIRQVLDRQATRKEASLEFWKMMLQTSWLEREHPKVFEALRWGAGQLHIRTDIHDVVYVLDLFYKVSKDEQMQRRQILFTKGDFQWKAGILYREGKFTEAETVLERARDLDATDPRTFYGLATLRALDGDAEKCADALDQARHFGWTNFAWIADDPDFARVRDEEAVKTVLAEK